MTESLLPWAARLLGRSLLEGTVLIALVWLATVLLQRTRPALVAALWTVVLVKFLLPSGPPLPATLDGALRAGWSHAHRVWNARRVAAPAPPLGEPRAAELPSEPVVTSSVRFDATAQVASEPLAVTAAPDESRTRASWQYLLLALYVAGVGFLGMRWARRLLRLKRTTRALPPADDALRESVAAMAARLGLRRVPDVRLTDRRISPYVSGCIAPVLVLPRWLGVRPTERDAVVAHELAHLWRRDPWVQLLQIAARTLFFFWPAVAWASRQLDRARERACDAWAVAVGPLGRVEYARFLVDLARQVETEDGGAPPALALLATGGSLERRVDMLIENAPRPRLGWTAAVFATFSLVALGGAQARAQKPLPGTSGGRPDNSPAERPGSIPPPARSTGLPASRPASGSTSSDWLDQASIAYSLASDIEFTQVLEPKLQSCYAQHGGQNDHKGMILLETTMPGGTRARYSSARIIMSSFPITPSFRKCVIDTVTAGDLDGVPPPPSTSTDITTVDFLPVAGGVKASPTDATRARSSGEDDLAVPETEPASSPLGDTGVAFANSPMPSQASTPSPKGGVPADWPAEARLSFAEGLYFERVLKPRLDSCYAQYSGQRERKGSIRLLASMPPDGSRAHYSSARIFSSDFPITPSFSKCVADTVTAAVLENVPPPRATLVRFSTVDFLPAQGASGSSITAGTASDASPQLAQTFSSRAGQLHLLPSQPDADALRKQEEEAQKDALDQAQAAQAPYEKHQVQQAVRTALPKPRWTPKTGQ